jgi:hypothetical protein
MNENSAFQVTLLQAFETAQPASPNWTDDDAAWATRLAHGELKVAPASGQASTDASAQNYITQRAHHAMQRLLPRETQAAKWLKPLGLGAPILAVVVGVTFILGLLADSIGSAQRINLLAPPLWAVVLWNAAVYLLLLGQWARSWFQGERQVGAFTRWMQTLLRWVHGGPSAAAVGSSPAMQAFAAEWLRRSAPLSVTRATVLLHAGSAALALGLIGGMYLRGLVLDYRASWESTFLSAETAHAALSFLLTPALRAAQIVLPNIALPDLAAFEALRSTHRAASNGAASGETWIHLYAVTLIGFVVLPRLGLVLWTALRARWMAGHFKLPLNDAYFSRLLRQQQGRQATVVVLPYACTPNDSTTTALRAVLATAMGPDITPSFLQSVPYGAEDEGAPKLPAGTSLALALFDLSATPEAETQGRFAQQVAAAASTVVVIDEAGFQRRFADAPERLKQRREAWRTWARALGTEPVFVNLQQLELKPAEHDLLAAMKAPVRKLQP